MICEQQPFKMSNDEYSMGAAWLDALCLFGMRVTPELMARVYAFDHENRPVDDYIIEKTRHFLRDPLGWWKSLDIGNRERFVKFIASIC